VIKLAVPVEMRSRKGRPECATVPEDSQDEIAQCVRAILATEVGQRVELPAFGMRDPAFVGADPIEIRAAIEQWEPRADGLGEVEWDDVMQRVDISLRTDEGA
jgi:phage baseplate assembly protein W